MTPEEREEMNRLCQQIAVEHDPEVFSNLIRQLTDLLCCQDRRLEHRDKRQL